MGIVDKKFSLIVKILIIVAGILVFIRILPILVIAAIAIWGIFKAVKYVKGLKISKTQFFKGRKKEDKHSDENSFDLKDKNVVDVEYENISSHKQSDRR